MPGIRMSISTTSGSCAGRRRDGRLAVGGLADHGDAVGCAQNDAEPGADQFLVVDYEYADRVVGSGGAGRHRAGSRAVTANPSAAVGPDA